MKNINIGPLVHKKIEECKMKVTDFADALCCSRSHAYTLFKRRNIDLEVLHRISKILAYDFVSLYIVEEAPRCNSIVVLETNDTKLKELSSDEKVKIIKTWKVSENEDTLSEI
jgi:hypothetical protein